jgi:hypothetical protein
MPERYAGFAACLCQPAQGLVRSYTITIEVMELHAVAANLCEIERIWSAVLAVIHSTTSFSRSSLL